MIPPQQHLYLLGKAHKDEKDKVAHDEMGFEDFFDMDLLQSHQGFHMMTMKEFMEKEVFRRASLCTYYEKKIIWCVIISNLHVL